MSPHASPLHRRPFVRPPTHQFWFLCVAATMPHNVLVHQQSSPLQPGSPLMRPPRASPRPPPRTSLSPSIRLLLPAENPPCRYPSR